MNASDVEAIEERFTRLERSVRLWKRAATVTIVLLVAIIAFTSTPRMREARAGDSSAKNLVAKSLTIVDEHGKPRIKLASIENSAALVLYDEKGTIRASLGTDNETGTALGLNDEKGKPRAALYGTRDGSALALFDEQGKPSAGLATDKGAPRLAIVDGQGTLRAVFGSAQLEDTRTGETEATGPSSVTLFDKDGKPIWRAP
jgi:hypothetical protein